MARSQAEKGGAFMALHERPGCFVVPNPWDVGTARLLAGLGFEALATTSAGLAFSLGRPDAEGALRREDVLANASDIAGATDLPVSADLEGGFADEPEGVAKTIRLAAEVGLVGGSIEDATGDTDDPIYELRAAGRARPLASGRRSAVLRPGPALRVPLGYSAFDVAHLRLHVRLDRARHGSKLHLQVRTDDQLSPCVLRSAEPATLNICFVLVARPTERPKWS